MNNVLLQPAAGAEASAHYQSTIHDGVSLERVAPHIGTKFLAELKKTAVGNKVLVWGLTPGEGNRNPATWEALSSGDLDLFSGKNCVRAAAIVTLKYRSSGLAKSLWDIKEGGQTWEFVYFLRDLKEFYVGYDEFNRIAGYASGFVIQGSMFPNPDVQLRILNAFALGWQSSSRLDLSHAAEAAVTDGSFDPQNVTDTRKKVLAAITQRQGQPQFRKSLLEAYGCRCVLTDCDAECALEAAHILPYTGPDTNYPSNGLLLRADIHTLFDLGLVTIDPEDLTVALDSSLSETYYKSLHGRKLRLPLSAEAAPSNEALRLRLDLLKSKNRLAVRAVD